MTSAKSGSTMAFLDTTPREPVCSPLPRRFPVDCTPLLICARAALSVAMHPPWHAAVVSCSLATVLSVQIIHSPRHLLSVRPHRMLWRYLDRSSLYSDAAAGSAASLASF